MWKVVESMWQVVESIWNDVESMGECMESMIEYMESIAEYMEQKHSTWNPPGMWGQGKVLQKSHQKHSQKPCQKSNTIQKS